MKLRELQMTAASNVFLQLVLFMLLITHQLVAVDRGNFKTCDQSFCKWHRALEPFSSRYIAVHSSISVSQSSISFQVLNLENSAKFKLDIYSLEDNTVRLKIKELEPIKERFEIPVGDVLVSEPRLASLKLMSSGAEQSVIETSAGSKIIVTYAPLRIDIIVAGDPVISFNSRGLFKFEHLRTKKAQPETPPEGEETTTKQPEEGTPDEEEVWEETFKTHTDSKPNGPSTIGLDVSFPGCEHVYGIPEHADSLALKSTKSTDPYRMYNLDVFEFEIGNPMALYGAVPFMIAHNTKRTIGMFYHNAAEMWIDVNSNTADKNMFSKLMDYVKGGDELPQIDTHWMVESGVVDIFFVLGPRPVDVFRQYAALTGTTPLPPLFAIAYHQSRWNYNDEQDVVSVNAGFDKHDIPLDVIWLDIEHTDGKRYFTWDGNKFSHSVDMINNVSATGRKMVTIVDPHIKKDDNYFVYKEARDLGLFVKNKDGNGDFEGWCWPGTSSWIDFFNPAGRKFWASKFMLDQYVGSTLDLFTWNDMNEPSVFSGPEVTMPKDLQHFGGWEHRDLHNIYGFYVHGATIDGQLMRDRNQRPFVLSRAFFAGSQRWGAVWTGDNTGDWTHLKSSLPMVLALNLAGITLSGADVGGFFKNPDAELLTRWYQTAALQPFFRAHAHLDTKRREPWLLPQEHLTAIRNAIRLRYQLLPYWYTLFYKAEREGGPVMRPLWVEFPSEKDIFTVEETHMIGGGILARPITDAGSTGVSVFLPGGPSQLWYEFDTYQEYYGGKSIYIPVNIHKIPLFWRGGYIVPIKERIRRASSLAPNDPYTLHVALDAMGEAMGELYHDDFKSFHYRSGQFVHRKFTFTQNKLTSQSLNKDQFATKAWIERIKVVGVKTKPTRILLTSSETSHPVSLEGMYDAARKLLVIRKPGVKITSNFIISIEA